MAEQIITQEYLNSIFEYKNGSLYWKVSKAKKIRIGDIAGCITNKRYLRTIINGKLYLNHRLIFLMHHGYLPKMIDHINGNSLDNKIENLRECNQQQNNYNQKLNANNLSGIKGVSWHKKQKKWIVQLQVNGKKCFFGYYKDIDYAKFIADSMRYKYHKQYANYG
jgi:hypothetical protein